jgi:delta 1-pyrroline-5-carboxylate dehydrogenase
MEIQRERSKPLRLPDQDEQNAVTVKLEKRLAKQRALRMAAIELSAKAGEESESVDLNLMSQTQTDKVFPKYEGDMFSTAGSYLGGMLYLSRMADSSLKTKKLQKSMLDVDKEKKEKELLEMEQKKKNEKAERDANNKLADTNVAENSAEDFHAKLTCAQSLCNWSRNPANAARLCGEGAVRAIMQLSMESSDQITYYCAACFRFMSEQKVLASSMIDEGAISTISELSSIKTDEFTLTNLAIALVNLTRVNGK